MNIMAGRHMTIMWTWSTNIYVHKLILYLTENAVIFYYKEQTVNPVEWNARFFSWDSCETHSSVHPSILQRVRSLFQIKFSRVRSSASSFNFHYSLFSLRSSHSCLRLLPCLTAVTFSFLIFVLLYCVLESSSYTWAYMHIIYYIYCGLYTVKD